MTQMARVVLQEKDVDLERHDDLEKDMVIWKRHQFPFLRDLASLHVLQGVSMGNTFLGAMMNFLEQ
jgi:hypothetical protein